MGKNVLDIQWMATNLFLMFGWLEDPHGKMSMIFFCNRKNKNFELWGIDYSKDGEF